MPAFSPDGKWLATNGDECRLWEVGSWRLDRVIPRGEARGNSKALAFSRDGKVLAIAYSSRVIRLVEPSTGRELATLAAPHAVGVARLCFSPDGSRLAAACSNHVIQVWDLARVRRGLAEMGLDWDAPPYPSVKAAAPGGRAPVPLAVEIVGAAPEAK